jgi:hypothetical protein
MHRSPAGTPHSRQGFERCGEGNFLETRGAHPLGERNGRDHTRRFAALAAAITELSARTLVLDGEVAIYDQQLRSRFDWLREPDPDAVASPPLFMAFDLLYHDRRDLTARPLRERRARLEDVVANNDLVFPVRRLAPDGLAAWAQVIECGYEGYVPRTSVARTTAGDEAVVEGRAEELDTRRGPLAAADLRGRTGHGAVGTKGLAVRRAGRRASRHSVSQCA